VYAGVGVGVWLGSAGVEGGGGKDCGGDGAPQVLNKRIPIISVDNNNIRFISAS